MTRQLRQDYPGATHHIYVRGVARSKVALDESDYERALLLLERAIISFDLRCHAWCFLPNHSHLLVTSKLGNISRAMHWLGTCTAQWFNRRYEQSGHVYQGRFGSRLVEDDEYLLELARYLPLNPVKAGLCESPVQWPWSSYAATVGQRTPPWFLDSGPLVSKLGSPDAYGAWVLDGLLATALDDHGVPRPPTRPELAVLLATPSDDAIAGAHFRHGHTQAAIARHLGVSRDQIRRRLGLAVT